MISNNLINTIDFVANALPVRCLPEMSIEGVCCVTGIVTQTIARHYAICNSFTAHDLLCAPMSNRVGVAAWRVLRHTILNPDLSKKRDLRPLQQSHWICDGQIIKFLNLKDVRKYVIDGVNMDRWVGYVTTSCKKHGVLMAPININCQQVWLWENRLVDCSDRFSVSNIWRRLCIAQNMGICRSLIKSLNITSNCINKIGWRVWRDFEVWARSYVYSSLYQFLAYLLPSH